MTRSERIIELSDKYYYQGGLRAEELKELNALIDEHLNAAQVSASDVKDSNGVVSEEKAGLLSRAWDCTVSLAKKVWNWICEFFWMIAGLPGRGFKTVMGWFKKSSKKVAAKVIDIKAQQVA